MPVRSSLLEPNRRPSVFTLFIKRGHRVRRRLYCRRGEGYLQSGRGRGWLQPEHWDREHSRGLLRFRCKKNAPRYTTMTRANQSHLDRDCAAIDEASDGLPMPSAAVGCRLLEELVPPQPAHPVRGQSIARSGDELRPGYLRPIVCLRGVPSNKREPRRSLDLRAGPDTGVTARRYGGTRCAQSSVCPRRTSSRATRLHRRSRVSPYGSLVLSFWNSRRRRPSKPCLHTAPSNLRTNISIRSGRIWPLGSQFSPCLEAEVQKLFVQMSENARRRRDRRLRMQL